MTAREFLHLLWSEKPKELRLLIWTVDAHGAKLSYWRQSPDDAADVIAAYPDREIYVGVGLSPKDFGPHARCKAEQIAGVAGVWMDIDLAGAAHSGKSLPATIEEALRCLPKEFPPSLVVASGHGVHVYWLLKELEIFSDAAERECARRIIWRWQTLLCQLAKAAHGWRLDRLADLARVLRPPGTRNFKDRQAPAAVSVYSQSEARYNLSDFDELADRMGVPESEAAEAAPVSGGAATPSPPRTRALPTTVNGQEPAPVGSGLDGEFEIRLDAAIPEETLALWLEGDPRFFKTWNKLRDREFASPSEYDYSLANFALALRLPAQTAVDLIVHWRRLQALRDPRVKPRTRRDYYARAFRKVRSNSLASPPAAPPTAEPARAPSTNGGAAPAEEPPATGGKAALVEWISRQLGLPRPAIAILKITGGDPTYQIVFGDGMRLALPDAHDLFDQQRLRWALIKSDLNYNMPAFKPMAWKLIADRILESLTEIEGGAENELAGVLRARLEFYLDNHRFLLAGETPTARTDQLPSVIAGRVSISALHFQYHLELQWRYRLSIREIAGGLVALGAEQRRFQRNGRDYSRWLLPAELFAPQDFHPDEEEKPTNERKPN